jgi:hypothetical protein
MTAHAKTFAMTEIAVGDRMDNFLWEH